MILPRVAMILPRWMERYSLWRRGVTWCYIRRYAREVCEQRHRRYPHINKIIYLLVKYTRIIIVDNNNVNNDNTTTSTTTTTTTNDNNNDNYIYLYVYIIIYKTVSYTCTGPHGVDNEPLEPGDPWLRLRTSICDI